MKPFKYLLLYLLIIELILPGIVPMDAAYHHRINYTVVKDNPANIDVILDQIEREIKSRDLKDYIIVLGDSVGFSGPGPSQESIGVYLEQYYREKGQPAAVFNLAMPAMQVGDIYTMLLKLDRHGISTDHVIMNLIYAGFTQRNPDPPVVFWLQRELQELDPQSFNQVKHQLEANKTNPEMGVTGRLHQWITQRLAIYRYKDFIKADLQQYYQKLTGQKLDDSLGDYRPWYQKEGLKKLLETPTYQNGFSTRPFDMSMHNPQIYFLERIMEHQQGKQTLVFLAPLNPELVEQVKQPAYQANLQRVKEYFALHQQAYIDFNSQIDQALFSDHVHLTGAGYAQLAYALGKNFTLGDQKP